MHLKEAELEDFEIVFRFIKELWDYNTYDREETYEVYQKTISDKNSFVYLLKDEDQYYGFCHGVYFNTFWMSGMTCYLSSLFVDPAVRGKGYGIIMLNHILSIAEKYECKAVILDSGMSRTATHQFYESHGFEKGCYGFEYIF